MDNKKSVVYVGYSVVLIALYAFAMYKAMKIQVGLVTTAFITVVITCVFLLSFLLCEGMLRLCQTLIMYAVSEESFWYILRSYFAPNVVLVTILVVSMLMLSIYSIIERRSPLDCAWDFGSSVCMPLIALAFCLLRMSNLAEWELKSFNLNVVNGLDYGTGMAYSFYYGYLRLMLPSTGTATKGIIEKIENFEDNHNVTFPVHKLFILIPSSGYVPPDLKEVSYQWMESVNKLEEEQRSRAGNIGRQYSNNAYKIYPGGRNLNNNPVYVVVEGASPLLTYYEVQQHNHPESIIYKQYKSYIIHKFHVKLEEILQSNPETRGLCELIYYDDYDKNGDKVNVAEILLERISKITDSLK